MISVICRYYIYFSYSSLFPSFAWLFLLHLYLIELFKSISELFLIVLFIFSVTSSYCSYLSLFQLFLIISYISVITHYFINFIYFSLFCSISRSFLNIIFIFWFISQYFSYSGSFYSFTIVSNIYHHPRHSSQAIDTLFQRVTSSSAGYDSRLALLSIRNPFRISSHYTCWNLCAHDSSLARVNSCLVSFGLWSRVHPSRLDSVR